MAAQASQKCALLFLRQTKKKQLMPTRLILLSDLWRAKSGDGEDRCVFSECFRKSWAPSGIHNFCVDISDVAQLEKRAEYLNQGHGSSVQGSQQ